jgi:endonuclease/exonuclease/phosphatase family metal-dependent hydrolase
MPPRGVPGFEPPPTETTDVLRKLSAGLDERIPAKVVDRNLLIGTWNIQAFGRITPRWTPKADDSPKRNLTDLCCIAEIVSRFDVVALVEVKRNLEALRLLMEVLGPDWGFIVTDTVEGEAGNDERLGFVYDRRRIQLAGLAGEIVIADDELRGADAILKDQFARTPYAVSFRAGDKGFTLVSIHVLWGSGDPKERTPELRRFAKWLSEASRDPDDFNRNMIALGDFNIDRHDDPNWRAFVVEYGLSPPDKLFDVPRTVGDTTAKHSYFDQIAWFTTGKGSALTLNYSGQAGGFMWTDYLLVGEQRRRKESRISDHYPLWVEFLLRD